MVKTAMATGNWNKHPYLRHVHCDYNCKQNKLTANPVTSGGVANKGQQSQGAQQTKSPNKLRRGNPQQLLSLYKQKVFEGVRAKYWFVQNLSNSF
jgi:hypothetical protein